MQAARVQGPTGICQPQHTTIQRDTTCVSTRRRKPASPRDSCHLPTTTEHNPRVQGTAGIYQPQDNITTCESKRQLSFTNHNTTQPASPRDSWHLSTTTQRHPPVQGTAGIYQPQHNITRESNEPLAFINHSTTSQSASPRDNWHLLTTKQQNPPVQGTAGIYQPHHNATRESKLEFISQTTLQPVSARDG